MPALGIHSNEVNLSWSELQKQFPSKQTVAASQNGHHTPAALSCLQVQTNGNHILEDQEDSTPPRLPFDNSTNGNDTMNGNICTDTVNGNDFAATVDPAPLDNDSVRRTPAPLGRPLHNGAGGNISAKRARHRTLVDSINTQPCIINSNLNGTEQHTSNTPALNTQSTNGVKHDSDPATSLHSVSGAGAPPPTTTRTRPSKPEEADSNISGSILRKRPLEQSPDVIESVPTPPKSPPPYRHLLGDISPFQTSYKGVSESAGAWGELGHYNILHVTTRDPGQHWFTRYCCYLVHCSRLKVNFPYPVICNKAIIDDDRVQAALDQAVCEGLAPQPPPTDGSVAPPRNTTQQYQDMMAQQVARAHSLLNNMKAAISTALIRLTGYVLFKVFSRLLTSVVVHKGQLEAIQQASKKGTPLIFVPLHRSHVDYLFVTWVLFNCQIPAPIVAAGDNLNMPVFGALLRGTGGFFIKRRLESSKARRDVLYRALLQCYISHTLHAGYNLEFFIEGGRTRTGKPAMPKGGLLSVIVDAYLSGLLDDAMVVPIAINYDRLVDGNFIREQLGQSKVPESFWGAVCAICKVLSTNYGQSRIDFGAPFSLREFVRTSRIPVAQLQAVGGNAALSGFSAPASKGHQRSLSTPVSAAHLSVRRVPSNPPSANTDCTTIAPVADAKMHPAMSNSSLFGTELTDEFRELVKKLGQHIVFDAERCQAMMSSNLVAWLCSFVYRDGVTLPTLAKALSDLRAELHLRSRDVGFTGEPVDVVKHAVRLLGPGLIQTEVVPGKEITYRPVTILPNVIELNYYANALLPVFALDAIVATSVQSVLECDLWSYIDCETTITLELDKVMRRSVRLCELLLHEFVLVAPCGKLPAKLLDTVDRLQLSGLLAENKSYTKRNMRRLRRTDEDDMDNWLPQGEEAAGESDDSDSPLYTLVYNVNPTSDNLRPLAAHTAMLSPILDAYCTTVQCMQQHLVGNSMLEKDFVSKTQALVEEKLNDGIINFGESIAADPIKNCIKMLEGERVLQSCQQEGSTSKLLSLTPPYDSTESITALLDSVSALRA